MNKMKHLIFLTGFMGSGKTSIGKKIANTLGYDFFDTDEILEQKVGLSIVDIFKNKGEYTFREYEKSICSEICSKKYAVIALGGGFLLQKENARQISNSGIVVFIDRDIKDIIKDIVNDEKRPLAFKKEEEELNIMYNNRKEIYNKYSDIVQKNIDINDSVSSICNTIKKLYNIKYK